MAESSIQVYVLVLVTAVAFGGILFSLRSRDIEPKYKINSPLTFYIGFIIIGIGFTFITGGLFLMEASGIFTQYHDPEMYDFSEPVDIIWEDPDPQRDWLQRVEITSTDDNVLKSGVQKRLSISINAKQKPEALIVHIFHEDYRDFFKSFDDQANFRPLSLELDKSLHLKYGGIFNLVFNMTKYQNDKLEKPEEDFHFHEFATGNFNYAGKYYIHFSAKLDSGEIVHRTSPLRLIEIPDDREVWITDNIADARADIRLHSINSNKTLGLSYLGIGIAMFLGGITLISPTVVKRIQKS